MSTSLHHSLKHQNSFLIEAHCRQIISPSSIDDLLALPNLSQQDFYILGEGTNTLFTERNTPLIICPNFKGIEINETATDYIVKVGASENWHHLVKYCIKRNIFGLENLALIPGSVGAAPVQNIGAYGIEFADYCLDVHWFEFDTKEMKVFNKAACNFAYRESIFKQSSANKGLITHITLKLPKKWQANLSYQGLDVLPKVTSAKQVMEQVILLRESKLPDPKLLPNAGSFFKNPIVEQEKLNQLKQNYPHIPYYPQNNHKVKLAAGWLIDQCGLKGYRIKDVGVHKNQALVLVNYGSAKGKDIVELAIYVQTCVDKKFAIHLQPEVKMVTEKGEVMFDELKNKWLK